MSQTAIELEPVHEQTGRKIGITLHDEAVTDFDNNSVGSAHCSQSIAVIAALTINVAMNTMATGLVTINIPQMAADVGLPSDLLNWPVLVYSLTGGATLLLFGVIADVIGARTINLLGTFLLGFFTLSTGLARTGTQLILFRAIQGLCAAMVNPTCVSIISRRLPSGRIRNLGFGFQSMGQTIGYTLGLVLAGVFQATIGWRAGYFVVGAVTLVDFAVSWWVLPQDVHVAVTEGSKRQKLAHSLMRLREEVDWIGAGIASACMSILAYVLAMVATSTSNIHKPSIIALIVIGVALIPAFVLWMARQERSGKRALIPNSLWKNVSFTSTCVMVLLTYAMSQTVEFLCNLFFQQVQQLSTLQSSIRFLPGLALGMFLDVGTGSAIHRLSAYYLVLSVCVLSAGAPLLMALIRSDWPYWHAAFPAQLLLPCSLHVLIPVGLLIIADTFPPESQSLAGAVFNTVGRFGHAFGLAIVAVISNSVTTKQSGYAKGSPEALLQGYHAGFWASFAWSVAAVVVGAVGLRGLGRVGLKRE